MDKKTGFKNTLKWSGVAIFFVAMLVYAVATTTQITDTGQITGITQINSIKYVRQGDAANLESQFNSLAAGETLIIPCGLYEIDQALYLLAPNVTVMGMGKGCTVIKQAADANLANKSADRDLALIQIGIDADDTRYNTYDVTLKDFTLDFNQAAQSGAAYYGRSNESLLNGVGIYVDGTDNIMIENVEVIDAYSIGIWLYGTDAESNQADIKGTPTVRDCTVTCENCGGQMIGIMTSGNLIYDAMITNNYVNTNATNLQGIRGEEMLWGSIDHNTVINPSGNAIGVYEHSATPSYLDQFVTIAFNTVEGACQAGIQIGAKSDHFKVIGNNIKPNSAGSKCTNGIQVYSTGIEDVDDVLIFGNTVSASTRGIYLYDTGALGVVNSVIEGNTILDATTGLVIQNNSDSNKAVNNVFISTATAITDAGSSNKYYDNTGSTIESTKNAYNTQFIQTTDTGLSISHTDTNSYGFTAVINGDVTATVNAQNRFDCRGSGSTKACLQVDSDSTAAAALDLTPASDYALTMTAAKKICLDSTTCSLYMSSSAFNVPAITTTGTLSFGTNDVNDLGMIGLNDATELTIASGSITVTQTFHSIDTEGDAASDELTTIAGGGNGDIVIFYAANDARDVIFVDQTSGTNSLRLAGNFTLDSQEDTITLIRRGGVWQEISRSDNR